MLAHLAPREWLGSRLHLTAQPRFYIPVLAATTQSVVFERQRTKDWGCVSLRACKWGATSGCAMLDEGPDPGSKATKRLVPGRGDWPASASARHSCRHSSHEEGKRGGGGRGDSSSAAERS